MIEVDKKRFLRVFGLIFEAHKNATGIFAKHSAETSGPQNVFWPQTAAKGSRNHLYWLALVAFSDRRTNSTFLYKNFAKMFEENGFLFERGFKPSIAQMTDLFRFYKIALPVKEIALFIERKSHLDDVFGGDPLNIYAGVEDVNGLMKKLKAIAKEKGIKNLIPGAAEKIFCLLAMFLREFVQMDFADIVPVDVWVQSIATSTGVLKGNGHIKFETLGHRLRPLMTKAFLRYRKVSGATNATWILGKYGCTHCAGTSMCNLCPVYRLCKGPFERMKHPDTKKHSGAIQVPPHYKPKHKD